MNQALNWQVMNADGHVLPHEILIIYDLAWFPLVLQLSNSLLEDIAKTVSRHCNGVSVLSDRVLEFNSVDEDAVLSVGVVLALSFVHAYYSWVFFKCILAVWTPSSCSVITLSVLDAIVFHQGLIVRNLISCASFDRSVEVLGVLLDSI